MRRLLSLTLLGTFIVLLSVACTKGSEGGSGGNEGENADGPVASSTSNSMQLTIHDFKDARPANDTIAVSVTITNISRRVPQKRKFHTISCLLVDSQGNTVGYSSCATGGLLPKESKSFDFRFQALNPEQVEQFLVWDSNYSETLAAINVSTGAPVPDPLSEAESLFADERYQGRNFSSADEWSRTVREWEARRPPFPGPAKSAMAGTVGLRLTRQLDQDGIRNDKWKHCKLGAEIAAATDKRTAEYAAWMKEYRDLTDGNSGSGFDEIDFNATVDGARQIKGGTSSPTLIGKTIGTALASKDSSEVCDQRWGDRYNSWDGTSPLP